MNAPLPINLMLVEDERVVAFDLKMQLQSFGYRVGAVVASGEEAVERVAAEAPDLILMDIHLEGEMDGVEAALEIQSRHQVPVIYLTAYAEDDTLKRALESRPFGYLVKPWNVRELHASIQMALARRRAEVAVEDSEQRFKLAMDAASLGVLEWSTADNSLHGEGHLTPLVGDLPMPLNEPADVFLARLEPQDRDLVVEALERTQSSGESVRVEFRTSGASGHLHFLEARLRAQWGPNTEKRVVGILQDVTERHRSEDRLRQSSVVFRTAAEAILLTNAACRITAANASFTRITGYTEEEVLGSEPDALLHARRGGGANLAELAAGDAEFWQGEVLFRRRNGEVFPAWQSLSVVHDGAGKVSNYVVAFSDVTGLRAVQDKLNYLAHHDPLTGLPNRLLFDERLDHAISIAKDKNTQCLLLFLDLDSFKVVNDTLGHAMGDELLRVVASRLKSALRTSDTVARFGGDEFLILAGSTLPAYAAQLAEKILDALRVPIVLADDAITVMGSIGIAIYPDHGSDRHHLLRSADIAMYSAKSQGRNRYQFYTADMAERSRERLQVEQGLRQAMVTDGLTLCYQPQVSLANRRIIGVEALVRWVHPQLGPMPPTRFIPVAEESGVIENLGRWVLQRACEEMRGVMDGDGRQLRLAVNVSARQFMREGFAQIVGDILAETGFPADALELEITESTLQSIERSVEIVAALKGLGIAISIDDFGTGYSSLSVLRDLPIDQIKIDRSFVLEVPENPAALAMVEAVVTLARSLRMTTLVEGIEREEQAAALSALGCCEAQGYLFSRPVTQSDLRQLLAQEGIPPQ